MVWPDIVIAGIFAIGLLKGWKRGFISEIGGFVAIVLALWAAFHYNGMFDGLVGSMTHLGEGSTHVVGLLVFALSVYVAMLVLSMVLGRIAQLPVVGIANAAGGAAIGLAKSALFVWIVLYLALFMPMSKDLRDDLRHSTLVQFEVQPNDGIDTAVMSTMPWFARPFVAGIFRGHKV